MRTCAVTLSLPLIVLAACQEDSGPQNMVAQAGVTRAQTQFSQRVEGLLAQMTLEEKLGQLHQAAGGRSRNLNSRLTPEELDRVRAGAVGSYLHVAGAEPLAELQRVAVEESRLGIPLLFAMDVVHGYRTIFPVPIAMASTWDEADWRNATRISAEEASASGLHWTFAPMIDIARDPRWGRIVEGAGADPYLGSRMAEAQVQGFQGESLAAGDTLLATAKHFGAYGVPIGGRDYGTADIGERSLYETYLPPFYAATQEGAGSMMTAFNDIDGVPSTSNEALIDGTLRARWGF
ncbi:glycoside hydrolase family 3 protein [Maricaulis sp. MIT060901]|uniref:glycoside hydrolase family 3 protein n=1 Tax=Maricaulis sp. MIT060901 TaxID=3096993 RepID=UPI00399A2399